MPIAIGDFSLPTLGDAIHGTEAMIGNVIEGVIEATTGQSVELTPGVGVDNSKVRGPRGSGDVTFDKKLASFDEVENLRKEVQTKLKELSRDVTKLKVQQASDKRLAPMGPRPFPARFGPAYGAPFPGQGNNNMLPMLLLMQPGGLDFRDNPAAMLMLAQSLSSSPMGYVGGQPISIDMTTIALLSTLLMPQRRQTADVRVINSGDPS